MNAQTNITNQRLLNPTAELGLLAAITVMVLSELLGSNPAKVPSASEGNQAVVKTNPLKPPAQGSIPVAFLISEGAQMIDFAGPWEVFQDVVVPGRADHPFHLYTVSESTAPIHGSQCPQFEACHPMPTRWPNSQSDTSGPMASITPITSWPGILGY